MNYIIDFDQIIYEWFVNKRVHNRGREWSEHIESSIPSHTERKIAITSVARKYDHVGLLVQQGLMIHSFGKKNVVISFGTGTSFTYS